MPRTPVTSPKTLNQGNAPRQGEVVVAQEWLCAALAQAYREHLGHPARLCLR